MRRRGRDPFTPPLSHPVVRVDHVISCVYCGGAHARPTDVRACWAEHEQPSLALDPEPASTSQLAVRASIAPSGWHARRGPVALGRNAVVTDAAGAPAGWEDCER